MKIFYPAALILLLSFSTHSFADPAQDASSDVLEQMFTWWNGIMNTERELKAEDFARYFTDDATIVLNGNEGVRGPAQMPEYFQKIRELTEFIEIVLPFKEKFQSGNKIFTYHTIRSTRDGLEQESHNMGYAIIENGKIASVNLARFSLDK
jgi:hypothetical protein